MGYHAQKTVTSTPIEACVGSGAMVTRNHLMIKNIGDKNIFYGYTSGEAAATTGMRLEPNASRIWTYEEQSKPGNPQHVYVASSGEETSTVCIEEY